MKPLTNGTINISKGSFTLRLDFRPWLERVPHRRYVLLHAQSAPRQGRCWGLLVVDGNSIAYTEAKKVDADLPHSGWQLREEPNLEPFMAVVYPDATLASMTNGCAVIGPIAQEPGID